MNDWSFGYYDQHGEKHGLCFGDSKPPAYFEVTQHPTEKHLRYYADKELEQRYQQLEYDYKALKLTALSMWDAINDFCVPAYAKEYRRQLECLGVCIDD